MKKLNLLITGSYLLISGCMVAAVGAAAVVTVDVVHDRRTVGSYVDDGKIEIDVRQFVIRDKQLRNDAHISVTSLNGIVLLTGEVPDQVCRARLPGGKTRSACNGPGCCF